MFTRFLVVLPLLVGAPADVHAQLISPGPLTAAHAKLEGIRNCVQCHQFGRKGAADDRCLGCHEPLESRVRAGRGYHARINGQECAGCHKEHFGREFAIVRIDTARFDHSQTGYRLAGAHGNASCGACHSADRIVAADMIAWGRQHGTLGSTLLGLGTDCSICHSVDDPHQSQFEARECDVCHATEAWDRAERFDHDRTGYRLTGEHRSASCEGCHPRTTVAGRAVVRYAGIRTDRCSTCHEDEHRGAFGGDCASCHDARGWSAVNRSRVADRFDHGSTGFPLMGEHASAACEACHARPRRRGDPVRIRVVAGTERAAYPTPHAGSCAACHVDPHLAETAGLPDQAACEACHDESGWLPASFSVDRHNEETGYPLTGAHLLVFCSSCHEENPGDRSLRFPVSEQECISCHRADDPHEGVFAGAACDQCHITESFGITTFDHTLAGGAACVSCHDADDPHAGQFGETGCGECHATDSFGIPGFDHTETRFPLDRGHRQVACRECHVTETAADGVAIVRFRPLRLECAACHGSPS